MRLIAGLLSEFLREIGVIQAFLIRYISRAKVSNDLIMSLYVDFPVESKDDLTDFYSKNWKYRF